MADDGGFKDKYAKLANATQAAARPAPKKPVSKPVLLGSKKKPPHQVS